MTHIQDLFFVAEISANHNGDIKRAYRLIELAASAGATAVKLQTYTADSMTLDLPEFSVSSEHPLWSKKNLYELYKEAQTPWDWHKELFNYARSLGLIPFSSPFDKSAVDFLETLDCPMYKIASLETGDLELISYVAKTMKPVIISTGASELSEIQEAVEAAINAGNENISLLVCTSSYPASASEAHVKRIKTLANSFNVQIGISDHTLGVGVSIAAIAMGATIIEKHLTIKRSEGGLDSTFSMEPIEFELLVSEGKKAYESLGNEEWKIQNSEKESRNLRRSLFIVKDVKVGDFATIENVRAIRPNGGTPPKYINNVIGKKFNDNYKAGTPVKIEYLQQ